MTATAIAGNRTTWTIDPAHSTIEFVAKHMMITTVKGRFAGAQGLTTHDGRSPAIVMRSIRRKWPW